MDPDSQPRTYKSKDNIKIELIPAASETSDNEICDLTTQFGLSPKQ